MFRSAPNMRRRAERRGRGGSPRAPTSSGVRRTRVVLALAAAVLVGAALLSGLLLRNLPSDGGPSPGLKTAAIVDQLVLSFPNPTFVNSATHLLEQAGYAVDYYPGDEVTVDFYRDLPTHGYDLILLRVHSGLARDRGEPTGYVSLFSGEPYDNTKYAKEEADGLVGRATQYTGGPQYFGIVPDFIESSMRGTFDGSTILVMGCDGLITDKTAEAFIQKGAKSVVGWSGRVSSTHTDTAVERLLQHLLAERQTIGDAVAHVMAEVGSDPAYDSQLLVYPPKP